MQMSIKWQPSKTIATETKDEEGRKKEIQVVEQIARANGYQQDEVDRIIGKMSARKGKQNTTMLKYSGAVPNEGKHDHQCQGMV